jgi:RNA polymerase sigma factor (sigma-70 family)
MEPLPALIIRAQQGDLDAFDVIVGRFQDMAYGYAYAMLGDFHLAQDAAQESFIEAYICLPSLREPAAFPGWFRRIVHKHADRFIRGKRVAMRPIDEATELIIGADPADEAETRETSRLIHRALTALPERERTAMTLFYFSGYAQSEIAELLDVPLTTVKKRLHDARRRLRERMLHLFEDALHDQRPSHDARFSRTVRFFIAVMTGEVTKVCALLAEDPTLVHAREEWDAATDERYPFPQRVSCGFTALHRAASNGDCALLDALLAAGADPNTRSSLGVTPLHFAALFGREDLAARLLTHGADPDAPTNTMMTPLHWAVLRAHRAVATVLIDHGADLTLRDKNGRSPLDWAAMKENQEPGTKN